MIATDGYEEPFEAPLALSPSRNGSRQPGGTATFRPTGSGGVFRYAREDGNREATRYLAAAALLDVHYAAMVVRRIVYQPFKALAPAHGADIGVVARWAVYSLRRREQRDVLLTLVLAAGLASAWLLLAWPVASLAALLAMIGAAWSVVCAEFWTRIYRVVVGQMLRGHFDPAGAPPPREHWEAERIAAVSARREGNLVVFSRHSAFAGSGVRLAREQMVIDVSHGTQVEDGEPLQPDPFSNADIHAALRSALARIGFPEMRVEDRLFVNGRHIKDHKAFLPKLKEPPATSVDPEIMQDCVLHPSPDARVYLCAEMPGWQGQLVVTLFARAVHTGGSLYIEWQYYVLPPVKAEFLQIDKLYDRPLRARLRHTCSWGARNAPGALLAAPFRVAAAGRRKRAAGKILAAQAYAIEHGLDFDYGAEKSIREEASGESRQHYFLGRDEIMYVLVSQQVLLREIRSFLRQRHVDLGEFESQAKVIVDATFKSYNVHVSNAEGVNVAVGDNARAGGAKQK